MKKFVIYKIFCKSNNKFYIGSASWYNKRIDKHLWGLRRNKHDNKYLQNAYNKYGENNFEFIIIEECDKENLIEREQFWLDETKCYDRNIGFNILKIAESPLGRKMSESAKKKIGDFWRGKKYSKERCKQRKDFVTKNQGKSVIQYDKNFNKIDEFLSISEASRKTSLAIATISRQCSERKNGRKYIFRYKDIV